MTQSREDIMRELAREGRDELLERLVNARLALESDSVTIESLARRREAWRTLAMELAKHVRLTPTDRTALVSGAIDRVVALGDDVHAVLEQIAKAKR